MSTGLLRHQDSLEQTIRERTAELEEANQTLNDDIEIRKEVERTLEQLRHRNEMILNTPVLSFKQKQPFSRQAITTGTADFLIISGDRTGNINVDDEADVCFVDAHTQGIGGGDRLVFSGHEITLQLSFNIGSKTSMVSNNIQSTIR